MSKSIVDAGSANCSTLTVYLENLFKSTYKANTRNLAPADIKKDGAAFDLPMAVGLLAASGIVKSGLAKRFLLLGELSLDGRLKPVRGVLPVAVAARNWELDGMILPPENAGEGAIAAGPPVFAAETLGVVVDFLNGERKLEAHRVDPAELLLHLTPEGADFFEVCGQEQAKRAIEIAAAGAHNLLMLSTI